MQATSTRIEVLETRIAPATIFAVDAAKNLITFDSATPGEILSSTPITGLFNPTDLVGGIDFRPATGELYLLGITPGVSDTARLYLVNRDTASLSPLGVPIGGVATGSSLGFDFNPVSDRIRVVNTSDQSFRLNPNDGSLSGTDTNLDDPAATESIDAVAYDRNFSGASVTTLFGIDFANNRLVRIGGVDGTPTPNGGVVTPIGPLGVAASSFQAGFDIEAATGTAYASLEVGGVTNLYTIDLGGGAATLVGAIGTGTTALTAFAVAPQFVKVVNATTATFRDADGDLVTIKTSAGDLNGAFFKAATKEGGGLQLRLVDLTGGSGNFQKTNLSITAKPAGGKGNGFTEIGFINATGLDLGKVVVDGDLGRISAGDNNTEPTSPAIVSLTVHSLGAFGIDTQLPLGSSLQSGISGALGKLVVKTDVIGATINVAAPAPENGSIRSIFIGGNLAGSATGGGRILSTGNMGAVKIFGSVAGTGVTDSGQISADGDIASVAVGGSLFGNAFANTGQIASDGKIGKVAIAGGLYGSQGSFSGGILGLAGVGPVTIGGSMLGAGGFASGSIWTDGSVGSVKVGGDMTGGSSFYSGSIRALLSIGSVAVKGSLSATISATTGIFAGRDLGAVSIGGNLGSHTATSPTVISATGDTDPTTAAQALTIKGIAVRGSVINSQILAGYLNGVTPENPDVVIGAIKIGGNWVQSVAAAGVVSNGLFADLNDVAVNDPTPNDNIVSQIASVTIKGSAMGTFGGSDGYGFVAQRIGKLRVGLTTYALQPGAGNDTTPILVGPTGDLRAREV
jgi:hypothetical protein